MNIYEEREKYKELVSLMHFSPLHPDEQDVYTEDFGNYRNFTGM